MRVIARKVLHDFSASHADVSEALNAWWSEARHADWKTPQDIKQQYASASIIADNRVVFNIKGNNYRLIVKIHYNTAIVYIRFIGTHNEYNQINAEEV